MGACSAWLVLLVFACLGGVSQAAIVWEASSLQDGIIIPACADQDVVLNWNYNTVGDERVVNTEWRFTPSGRTTEVILGTEVNGHFFADSAEMFTIQYIPRAGIRLVSVTPADSGTYSVHVHTQYGGHLDTSVRSANVVVTTAPVSASGQLQATLEGARYVNSTSDHHLVLTCGDFSPVWLPSVKVVWTTPTQETLASTFQENNQYALAVPNPLVAGEYSCTIDSSSAAMACLAVDSPLRRGATVLVDGVQGRLALMDSEVNSVKNQLQDLQNQRDQLTGQIQNIETDSAALTTYIQNLQDERARLELLITGAVTQVTVGSCDFDSDECGYQQDSTDDFDWTRTSGGTGSSSTGPASDHTSGSGYYMYTEASSKDTGDNATMVSPERPASSLGACVTFYYHMYGSTMGTLRVRVVRSGSSSAVWSMSGDQGNTWQQATVQLSPSTTSQPYRVAFEGIRGSNYYSDMAIDDVIILNGRC